MISISVEIGSAWNDIESVYNSRALMNGSKLFYAKMNITIRGNETSHDYHWTVLLLLPVVVFGVAGNVLVCMAVSMEKRLQSVTNYFLLSLAITDLLVCLIVWPFSILNEFVGYWPLNAAVCDIYVTSDVLMCTSSILHLCTISLERYIAIRSPLSTRQRSKTGVRVKIALVWAISFAISSPIMILGLVNKKNILNNNQCVLSNNDFIIYGSVSAFFIPLGIMGILFGFTIKLLRNQWKLCDPGQAENGKMNIRRSKSDQSIRMRRRKLRESRGEKVRRPNSCPSPPNCFGGLAVRFTQESDCDALDTPETSDYQISAKSSIRSSNAPSEVTVEEMVPLQESIHDSDQEIETDMRSADENDMRSGDENDNLDTINEIETPSHRLNVTKSHSTPSRLQEMVRKHHALWKSSSLVMLKKDSVKQKQHKNNVQTEQKASKVLGIVFVIFVLCWTPFFIVNILTALCEECNFDHLMVTIFVWLGYLSSTLNPIIYTAFNETFRTTFIKLLKCEYRFLQRPMQVKTISSGAFGLVQAPRNIATAYIQIPL